MALHGFPGGPQQFTSLGMNDLVDRAAAARTMRHAIVIAPQINSPSTVDTECVNAPGGLQTETWLAEDVPEFARTHFRVAQGPGSWATFGFSYGGWCAAMTTVRHPDVFGAAIVMQGYFRPELTPGYQPFQPGSAAWQSYDLARIAQHTPPPVALWLLTSRNDPPSYAQATRLEHAARAPLSVTNNVITGGHRVEVWAPHVPEAFAWLGATLPGFTP